MTKTEWLNKVNKACQVLGVPYDLMTHDIAFRENFWAEANRYWLGRNNVTIASQKLYINYLKWRKKDAKKARQTI